MNYILKNAFETSKLVCASNSDQHLTCGVCEEDDDGDSYDDDDQGERDGEGGDGQQLPRASTLSSTSRPGVFTHCLAHMARACVRVMQFTHARIYSLCAFACNSPKMLHFPG